MLDMDVSRYLVHGALLSHLGEQIALTAPILHRYPAASVYRIVWMIYILEKGILVGYD
jgi:hypothetical protein